MKVKVNWAGIFFATHRIALIAPAVVVRAIQIIRNVANNWIGKAIKHIRYKYVHSGCRLFNQKESSDSDCNKTFFLNIVCLYKKATTSPILTPSFNMEALACLRHDDDAQCVLKALACQRIRYTKRLYGWAASNVAGIQHHNHVPTYSFLKCGSYKMRMRFFVRVAVHLIV